MRNSIYFILILFIVSCKTDGIKKENNTINQQKEISKALPKIKKQFDIKRIIVKEEFNIYSYKKLIGGTFYNPKTDSLMLFEFHPINLDKKIKLILSKFDISDECDYNCKQKNLIQNISHFNVTGYKIDYNYVLEQKDAGGDDVFNVKEPFKAQKFIYKDGIITMDEIKSYKSFDVVYY